MFSNFIKSGIQLEDVFINYVIGGSGPPLLLLHGYPQTHFIWHQMADRLAEHFTVVASDLRGYGDSGNPPTDDRHQPYSKRVSGQDQVSLMRSLGYDNFFLAGHDRGGRVGHRMALDHPGAIRKLVVMDIAPTFAMYTNTDLEFARAYYHWFFLIQPFDLPERLIGHNPSFYLKRKLGLMGKRKDLSTSKAFSEYLRCFTPQTIHASCEDYRASATIDMEHDKHDLDREHKIDCPVLCLWGENGFVGKKYDVVAEWRVWADQVEGYGLPCGHYLPEEAPQETMKLLINFFSQ